MSVTPKFLWISLSSLFFLSVFLTRFYIDWAQSHKVLDIPGKRSSHKKATPRGGGAVFIGLWFLTGIGAYFFSLCTLQEVLIIFPGFALVALTGFVDDRLSLKASTRALLYVSASFMSIALLWYYYEVPYVSKDFFLSLSLYLFLVLCCTWSINLFNFMDGLDGIAGTQALFLFGVGAFFFWEKGVFGIAALLWFLTAVLLGFFYWNAPPAKVFMGDVGSTSLGFSAVIIPLVGKILYEIPLSPWLILYSPFLFDATLTLSRRILAKEKWYEAHKSHAYQRLHQEQDSHRKVLVEFLGLNLLTTALSLFAFYQAEFSMIASFLCLFLLISVYMFIEKIRPMKFPKV